MTNNGCKLDCDYNGGLGCDCLNRPEAAINLALVLQAKLHDFLPGFYFSKCDVYQILESYLGSNINKIPAPE